MLTFLPTFCPDSRFQGFEKIWLPGRFALKKRCLPPFKRIAAGSGKSMTRTAPWNPRSWGFEQMDGWAKKFASNSRDFFLGFARPRIISSFSWKKWLVVFAIFSGQTSFRFFGRRWQVRGMVIYAVTTSTPSGCVILPHFL